MSPCHDHELTPSTVCTKYSIHRVQYTPCTVYTRYSIYPVLHPLSSAYTDYCIVPRSTVYRSQLVPPLSSLGGPCCTRLCPFPQLQVNLSIESQLPSRILRDLPPLDRQPPTTPPILIDHGLQVCHQTRSIRDSKFTPSSPPKIISKLARSQPASASSNPLVCGLHVHLSSHDHSVIIRGS